MRAGSQMRSRADAMALHSSIAAQNHQRRLGGIEKHQAFGRKGVVPLAVYQQTPHFFLEGLHVVAQCGLGNIQPPRGLPEAPRLRQNHEFTHMARFHDGIRLP